MTEIGSKGEFGTLALDDTIKELQANISRLLRGKERKRKIVLARPELLEWLLTEPSFPRPIVKPLSDDSYHPSESDEDLTEPVNVMHL